MFDATTYGWGIFPDWTNFLGPFEEMDKLVESRFGASSDDFSLYLPGFRGLSHLELLCHEQPPATWHFE